MAAPAKARKSRRRATEEPSPIMVVPKQTPAEIARRVAIREAFHDVRAKTIKAKPR